MVTAYLPRYSLDAEKRGDYKREGIHVKLGALAVYQLTGLWLGVRVRVLLAHLYFLNFSDCHYFCCLVSCLPGSGVKTSNTSCYAVDGGFRMFFDGECTPDTDEETMTTIRDVINSGDYDRLDPRIVNAMYLEISDLLSLDDANTTSRIESVGSSETTKLPGYVIVLSTIAALFIVVGLLLFVGRRRPRETNGFDLIPDEGEGDF
mmetsp:Transcript_18398/g.33351  ORF Transcript_18398/g.33351 Transcript_18398/m.33351 type:complete len:205 (+) Transcript_18398:1974-2588(+)